MTASPRKIARLAESARRDSTVITVTLGTLVDSNQALARLGMQPLHAPIAFCIAKVIRDVNKEIEPFTEQRRKLLERFAEPLKDGDAEYRFATTAKRKEFESEYQELVKCNVTLPCALLRSSDIDNVAISAMDLVLLSWLFQD